MINQSPRIVFILLLAHCFALQLFAQVRITEVAPTNTGQIQDEDNDRPDWIEIRNGGTQTVNFLGWGLSDGARADRWILPDLELDPGERLLVFASGKDRGSTTPPAGGVHHWETAIYEDDSWHYQIGASNPPADWNTVGFDDSAWPTGPGGFGYGDGDDGTTVPNGTLSLYYRRQFDLSALNEIVSAVLSMDYDDGFIAYLNGQEIARSSTVSGQPSWNTLAGDHEATFYSNTALPEAFSFNQAQLSTLLQAGPNVLAVELHNTSTNSSDLSGRSWLHLGIGSNAQFFGPIPFWFNPSGGFSGNLHTNFKINFSDKLKLYDEQGGLVDSVSMQVLQPGHSFMRINDDGDWCITGIPTPNAANGYDCEGSYSSAPAFSIPAGFYTGNQTVAITGGGVIRFTEDGSEPDATSALYATPILITKNMVLRARRFENFKLPSEVATSTYFIDENVTLPVVSVTIPPAEFAAVYDNHSSKGLVAVQYFDKNKQEQFSGNFAGYVVGNWSVDFPQKSLQFDSDEDFGSLNEIQYPLFAPDKPIQPFHSFRIRNEDDDWTQARMRDRIVNELAAPTHSGRASYQNVIGFINGQYWGHYVARERLDNYFVRDNYGADPDSVNMVKTYFNLNLGITQDVAETGNLDDFEAMSGFISNNNMADVANFKQASQLLDLENFTDYLETEIFVASTDWLQDYYNNIRLFKSHKSDPWKFLLWDVSYSSGNPLGGSTCVGCDILGSTLVNSSRYGQMLGSLLDNSEYRRYFINRFADLMNTSFLPARAHALIDANAAELSPEIQRHHERWGTGDLTQWTEAVQILKNFYAQRPENQRQHIVDNFQLDQEVSITLEANPAGAGVIKISTVVPTQLPWTGIYFHGNPVTVTAIPNPGYTFSNWSANPNISDVNAQTFISDVALNTIFTANFEGAAQYTSLKISEINYNSDPTRDAGDWFELNNVGPFDIDLSDFTLRDKDWFHTYTLPTGTMLQAGGHLVLFQDKAEFFAENPAVGNALGPIPFHLDNDGDEVHLFDRTGAEVARASYKDGLPWPCTSDGFGTTLERVGPDPNMPESWVAGCVGGSPGVDFTPCIETPTISELNYKSAVTADAGDWIELYNRDSSPLDLSGWQISDVTGNLFLIPSGTVLPSGGFHVFAQNLIKFSAQFPAVANLTGPLGFGFSGNGDQVRLFSPDGRLYLSMCFDDAAPWPNEPDGKGYTLENGDFEGNINQAGNWFKGCLGGSPGEAFDINCGNVGTEESAETLNRLKIWPNPASDQLYFQAETSNSSELVLMDIFGRSILQQANTGGTGVLSLKNLPSGMYVVELRTKIGAVARQKLVVE